MFPMMRFLIPISLLLLCCLASLLFGARPDISLSDLKALFMSPDQLEINGIIVREMRLPRTIGAIIAGGSLGIAGALIQTLTRNPLADPGLLGVNSGAAVGIVLTVWWLGPVSQDTLILPALVGGFLVLMVVWTIGASSRSPLTLILAGAALTALLSAVLKGIILIDRFVLDTYRDWSIGVLDQVSFEGVETSLPLWGIGLGLAFIAAKQMDSFSLGEDVASSLGTNLRLARLSTLAGAGILSTTAVLLAGPLVFVGLVAPHIARALSPQNGLTLIFYAFISGSALVLFADTFGRIIAPGFVIEVGLGITLVGGIFLIAIVLREGRNPS